MGVKIMERTQRGFAIFGEIEDTRGCKIRVQQSSQDPCDCVWLFCEDVKGVYAGTNPDPHMNREQVKELINALNKYLEYTGKDEDYAHAIRNL